ncbi:tetratricopeptide repeat protein [Limosilactobacillus reuteri]|uniref:Tetratricopeptide repeat protein n=1 Tax=Limosilactobacillus reuteri TaxID=1598 RepID=A0ABD6XDN3_LIMRT|nr:tetratricopeptide repeat protein [Limosilactobacillus reuteri]MDD1380508.1 tetratricopeptide repeat protein [Limosilactobacillus reuteri]MQB70714.1 tetratricopeptide repeat protein [Limosilactobacillus reuteri]MQB84024.1 tetratricopeptide repeat protein [Limosilactobacillus reuteri]PTM28613.1 tetratricopeptide repeat protein [Limosilactobacillus reuteri]PTM30865.1 tetratricopeptide repeat protein [Limosilactobacillus reuteri]
MTYSEQMLDQLEAGKLKEAQNSFKLALINDDDDMLFSLAEELYALGFLQQARTIYLKLLDCYPDEDELKTNLATIAIDEGHNDEALSYLAQIKPDSPAYVQSLLVAADLYQTEEEFEVTEEKLKEAYALAPDEPAVEFALGEFYFMVGQYSEAIQYYFQLIKNGYTDFAKVDIAGRLGICYAQSGQFKKALGYFNQVKPEYQTSDIRFQKGLTRLQLGDTEKAIKTLEDLINDDNQYASAYPELAKAYEKENKYQQALRVVQEGLSVDQYNEYLYSLAAEITSYLGDQKLMKKYLVKAHELAPENMTITLQYSNFLLHQHDDEANIKLVSPLVKEDETDPQLYWNLARSYQRTDQLELAGKYYEAALPAYSENPTFLKELINYYRETGETDKLMDELEHYLRLVPTDTEMQDLYDQYEDYK